MRRHRPSKSVVVVVSCGFALFAGACRGGEAREPRSVTSTTSAALTTSTNAAMTPAATPAPVPPPPPPVATSTSVMRITTARCDREAACNRIGTGRSFGDRDACVNEVGHDVVAAIPAEECAAGVDEARLAACVADLQAQSCDTEAAPLDQVPSCGREQLCVRSF